MLRLYTEEQELACYTAENIQGYSIINRSLQTRNSGEFVWVNDVLDDTEGLTPLDTLLFLPNTRNFDIGGGKFDNGSEHLQFFYQVQNYVYDPYNRTPLHNESVLREITEQPVDTVTSLSVLNVILDEKERREHISLAYRALKENGLAFFKVWRGDGSGVPDKNKMQSNCDAKTYKQEVSQIFGEANVFIPADDLGNTIIAKKIP